MSSPGDVRFAWIVYLVAGIVGLLEIIPLYFLESTVNRMQPPAITHPEFYYAFVGIALAWQLAFLVISRDPVRFRALMPVSWIEKVLYPVTVGILYSAGRTHLETVFVALLDLVWLALFIVAWVRTPERY